MPAKTTLAKSKCPLNKWSNLIPDPSIKQYQLDD